MITSAAAIALVLALPAQAPCTASAPQVVDDIYKQVLERPADPGSAGFSRALGSGEMTVRDVVVRLAQSPEHLHRFSWQPVIAEIYRETLNRPPSPDEEQAAARMLANRMSIKGVAARVAVGAANNEADAVRILYQRLLGRDPDPEGMRANVTLAQRNGIDAVVRSMMSSPEYRMRAQDPASMREDAAAYRTGVQMLYRHMLNRDPDPEGFASMSQLAGVYGLAEVAHRIANSQEYMQRWGQNKVPGDFGIEFCGVGGSRGRQAIPRPRDPQPEEGPVRQRWPTFERN